MASVPQFYSDHSLFYDNYGFPTSTTNQKFTTMMMMQQLQGTTTFDDFQESNYNYYDPAIVNSSTTFLPESSVPTISSSFFPERFGIGDHNNNNDCNMDVPSLTLPHHQFNMNNNNNSSSIHLYNGNRSYNETFLQVADRFYDFGDEFSSDCKTTINTFTDATGKNWGNQKGVVEDTILKVGRYSMEERKDRILKYLKKRNQRNFNKTIKYACRKTLADRRVRVRGRFARNNIDQVSHEDDEEEVIPNNNNNNNDENINNNNYNFENKIHQNLNLFSSSATTTHAQIIKHDHEEDWLQEAMSHLMCFPYTVG